MNIGNTIIISSFFIISTLSLAMETALSKSQSMPINNGLPSGQPYNSYLNLGTFLAGFNHLSDCVASSLDSLSNTITNQISDEAAFRKLGWPLSDEIARQELEKSTLLYKRHNDSFKVFDEYFEYTNDCNAINRRTQYCQRVLWALYNNTILNHADRPKLALHCLQHHKQVLNDFDKSKFLFFVQIYQEKTKQDVKQLDQDMLHLTIVPHDNDLLNELLNQTIKQKEEEQKIKLAEEEKKRKEQIELEKQKELEKKKELEKQKQTKK